MKAFRAHHYSGVWIPFDGDRLKFRTTVEAYLRGSLNDQEGSLEVGEEGPRWISRKKINLSYSHSENWGLLVFSSDREIGVDIESKTRKFSLSPFKIAERYFSSEEQEFLKTLDERKQFFEFLKIWVKKEAYAKLTRKGLMKTIHQNLNVENDVFFSSAPVSPPEYLSSVATQIKLGN